MQRIQCLTLLAVVLLACVSGCAEQHRKLTHVISIEVDDVEYRMILCANVNRQGQVVTSLLVLAPLSGNVDGGWVTLKGEHTSDSGGVIIRSFHYSFNGIEEVLVTKNNILFFFIKGTEISIEKTYHDLVIDAQQLNASLEEVRDYLRPILEKLIRENVQPQEPEREEPL